MGVQGMSGFALEVPDVAEAVRFYTDAGLEVSASGAVTTLRCSGQDRDAISLVAGTRKRLHHVSLRAEDLDGIAARTAVAGGRIIAAPAPFSSDGLWIEDPHGMRIHLVEQPGEIALPAGEPFRINQPGELDRINRAGIKAVSQSAPGLPLRLGHVLVFTPDTMKSVAS